ncbi:hypothetical protein PHAVU_004G012300 [Phaseolus vulgaris]|uniref:Uncharacterized protein n=1 Tax=Phaseolus vulgaris TaxID=3885 RepID=V7C285_PHAVU|nr:hypothetical protein PHAVU_004G012300g [Phaseolus vulgaris]ESW23016.1 hypothetical protein PHAVU_004G012300g [Phaseolus vulgaris]
MKKKKNDGVEKKPRGRFVEEEGGGETIKCSGKHCGSCCGGYVADCVAVCCCPCAVLHCCVLALVKGPFLVGRKCLRLGKKKNKNQKKNKKKGHHEYDDDDDEVEVGVGGVSGSGSDVVDGFDAEKVWRELYQIGHLDFGRVSSSHDD